MASILEALQNANYNLSNARHQIQIEVAKHQLSNAVALLEKGYGLHHEVETLLSAHGNVDAVPEFGLELFTQPTNATT